MSLVSACDYWFGMWCRHLVILKVCINVVWVLLLVTLMSACASALICGIIISWCFKLFQGHIFIVKGNVVKSIFQSNPNVKDWLEIIAWRFFVGWDKWTHDVSLSNRKVIFGTFVISVEKKIVVCVESKNILCYKRI